MAFYRDGSAGFGRFNNNIIRSIHDLDLYEDDHRPYGAYAAQLIPRAMRQAPKLLTLDDYNLISLGYKPVSITASVAFYFSAVLSQLLLSIHGIALTPTMTVMFHLGVLFAWQILNLTPTRGLGYLSTLSGFFIVGLAVAVISAMLSLAEFSPSMGHIPFTAFLNYSGSSSALYAALSSTLMASFVFSPQDTVIRMVSISLIRNGSLLLGLPLIIVLNYGIIKPIKGLLDDAVPGVRIVLEALGRGIGTVFVAMILAAIFCTGFIRLAMAIRTVYSLARDGGVPHSAYWNHLHPQRKTPQRVSWLVTIACMCCIFPFFWGNSVAFQWIVSLGCISSNLCFVVPLWMRLTHEGSLHFIPSTFTLGRFSRPLHVVAIGWLLCHSLLLMLPTTLPLTKNNFNYAPVVLVALVILFEMSWVKARTDFTGGAKDVSRASHRIPFQTLKDSNTRTQQSFQYPMTAGSPSPLITLGLQQKQQQQTSDIMKQKYKNVGQDKTRQGKGHKVRTNSSSSSRFVANAQYQLPVSLGPPRRNAAKDAKCKQQRVYQQDSKLTLASNTSNQSHPSSILGIPLSESPEMLPLQLLSQPKVSYPPQSVSSDPEATRVDNSINSNLILKGALGRGLNMTDANDSTGVFPKISVAPSTTGGSTDKSGGQPLNEPSTLHYTHGVCSCSVPKAMLPTPDITFYQDRSENSSSTSSCDDERTEAVAALIAHHHPLNANETVNRTIMLSKARSSKNRVPTPYPSSPMDDPEDGILSDHTGESMRMALTADGPLSFTAGASLGAATAYSKGVSGEKRGVDRGELIEEVVSSLNMASSPSTHQQHLYLRQSLSNFPTLNGYPLLKSPSTGAVNALVDEGDSEGRHHQHYQHLPLMLPLSRTPTIQHSDFHDYGASFETVDSDYNDRERFHDLDHEDEDPSGFQGMTTEPDGSCEEEYNHDYPIVSIPQLRLQPSAPPTSDTLYPPPFSLPIMTAASLSSNASGLFQWPNRDISSKPGASFPTALPSVRGGTSPGRDGTSVGLAMGGSGDFTPMSPSLHPSTNSRPLPPLPSVLVAGKDRVEEIVPEQEEETLLEEQEQPKGPWGRHDPIERLLRTTTSDPVQQQWQRSQSVANWAQEQVLIQEQRVKHRAQIEALKEWRRQNPIARRGMLSIDSWDVEGVEDDLNLSEEGDGASLPSSSFSWSFPKSIFSGRAAIGDQDGSKKQYQRSRAGGGGGGSGAVGKVLQSLQEGQVLKLAGPSQMDIALRAQDEEEYQEYGYIRDSRTDLGLFVDAEVESVGAGVGVGDSMKA
ncbi:hypothetical protein EDD11_002445 [Mortierella claussenii]|nr:hypothetical protein EDD11_002445 [Mortierella claussenii]